MDGILAVLRTEFGLRKNHLLLLEALERRNLSAKDLAHTTGIPLGRIYGFLHELETEHLIDKSKTHPTTYSFLNRRTKLQDFVHYRLNRLIDAQSTINSIMEKTEHKEATEVIHTGESYALHTMNLIKEGGKLRVLVRNTSVCPDFYPFDKEEFLNVRSVIEKQYKKSIAPLSSGMFPYMVFFMFQEHTMAGRPIEYIVTKQGIDLHMHILKKEFSKQYVAQLIRDIIQHMTQYTNLNILMTEDFVPYNLYVSPSRVQLVLTHGDGVLTGFSSNNSGVISVYEELYESIERRSVPVIAYLRKILSSLGTEK